MMAIHSAFPRMVAESYTKARSDNECCLVCGSQWTRRFNASTPGTWRIVHLCADCVERYEITHQWDMDEWDYFLTWLREPPSFGRGIEL